MFRTHSSGAGGLVGNLIDEKMTHSLCLTKSQHILFTLFAIINKMSKNVPPPVCGFLFCVIERNQCPLNTRSLVSIH